MFIQKLAEESHNQAKLERKPRRNIQYKDVGKLASPSSAPFPALTQPFHLHPPPASAVSHQDNLEFLEDIVPKTTPFKKIKAAAAATQARLRGDQPLDEAARPSTAKSNGGTVSANTSPKMIVNGGAPTGTFSVPPRVEPDATRVSLGAMMTEDDPSEQLAMEMRQAAGSNRDGDVNMTG
jgi:DNA polymerase epsilon subunit 4